MLKILRWIVVFEFLLCVQAMAADEVLLRQIYTEIPAASLEPLNVEDLAVSMLKGLSDIDKKLQVSNGLNISLFYKRTMLKSLKKPEDKNDVEAWTALSGAISDAAVSASRKAAQHDFELIELMLSAAVNKMGNGAKLYMTSEPEREHRIKHRPHFASRTEGDILYIKILLFDGATTAGVTEEIKRHPDMRGLILDLRGNPGGRFDEAIKTAGLFLDGEIIASTKGKNAVDTVIFNAEKGDILQGKEMVVLVDADTASAAEVLVAALKEQGRAKVVGTQTFGKASVQKLIELSGGAVAAITKAYYYTPSGQLIEKEGVLPDVCTFEMPDSKKIDNLDTLKNFDSCYRESREKDMLEVDIARQLIETSVKLKN